MAILYHYNNALKYFICLCCLFLLRLSFSFVHCVCDSDYQFAIFKIFLSRCPFPLRHCNACPSYYPFGIFKSSSCSTSGTRCGTHVDNLVISHEREEGRGSWLRQTDYNHGLLWNHKPTGATCGAWTAYLSGVSGFIPGWCGVRRFNRSVSM
jgi:hypothetical protein